MTRRDESWWPDLPAEIEEEATLAIAAAAAAAADRAAQPAVLAELGAELRARLEHEKAARRGAASRDAPGRPAPAPGAAPRARRRRPFDGRREASPTPRVLRRSAIAVVLLCFVGAAAHAGLKALDGGPPADSEPVQVATGHDRDGPWLMTLHRHQSRLCVGFVAGGGTAAACDQPPRERTLVVTSAAGGTRRYVVGVAGAAVASVRVRSDGRRATARTVAVPEDEATRDAGVPAGLRRFVTSLPAGTADAPVWVTAVGRDGRPLGRPLLDCSLGSATAVCRRLAERRSGG